MSMWETAKNVFRKDEMWTMKDGTRIAVSDMTERHAKNVLRLVIRRIVAHNNKANSTYKLYDEIMLGDGDWEIDPDIGDK